MGNIASSNLKIINWSIDVDNLVNTIGTIDFHRRRLAMSSDKRRELRMHMLQIRLSREKENDVRSGIMNQG